MGLPTTVEPLELLWAGASLVGWLRWINRYRSEYCRRREIDPDDWKLAPDRVVANIRAIRALLIADGLLAYLGISIISLTLPPGPLTDTSSPGAWAITVLLFTVPVALILTGEIFDRMEKSLAEMLREYQRIYAERERAERKEHRPPTL